MYPEYDINVKGLIINELVERKKQMVKKEME